MNTEHQLIVLLGVILLFHWQFFSCCQSMLFVQVQQAFECAYVNLTRAVRSSSSTTSILSKIISIDKKTLDYRRWVKENFTDPDEQQQKEEGETNTANRLGTDY